ncbi:unnamed protein product [Prunus armeniaca]|uniref:Uncharacterized protein n=1 Tax=Prunus armeniaca TaxID=36596 RepID=A0A6J5XQ35_PRUAR|nr:unnamed protein product [Prunus armeniaca]CAB4314005.1 unnamed protein product [Prunus armeniaca]
MSSADSLTSQLDDYLRLDHACSDVVLVGVIIAYVTPNIGSIKGLYVYMGSIWESYDSTL